MKDKTKASLEGQQLTMGMTPLDLLLLPKMR